MFQRRLDNSVDFYQRWDEYVAGFGNLSGNLWAGLDKVHAMTTAYPTELYVFMESFEGESAYAQYSNFSVDDASTGYRMKVSGYNGTAGDAMEYHNNHQFTTYDRDQDTRSGTNCAVKFHGAWWYNRCHDANPNGLYLHGTVTSFAVSVTWEHWKGHYYSLKTVEFKVRRV